MIPKLIRQPHMVPIDAPIGTTHRYVWAVGNLSATRSGDI